MEGDRPPNAKAKLTEVNSYLTCPLCKGYYIDATTIVECLHSFCRSCIIQHLQQDNYCPICELMINTAKPNIKADKTLQDIVYKLVPGLYASEMARRRRFWSSRAAEASRVPCPEARGLMTERIIFSPQDAISLSIEYTSDELAAWQRSEPDPEVPLRRYLQCPAMLRVEHLKKFICNKYNVDNHLYHVDILYKRVPLPDHYTLMDIAYIYSWKRNEPMKFFFRITDVTLVSERFDYFEPSSKQTIPVARLQQRTTKQHTIVNNNNNIEKKSPSPVRQHSEISNASSDDVKPCDSVKKLTELSDKKDVVSDKNKCENSEKCGGEKDKEQQEVVNNNQKEISETSDNNKCDKQISENSETNKVKDEKVVVKIESEVKIEPVDSNKTESVKPPNETSSKTDSSKPEVLNDESKVPINNKPEEKPETAPTKPVENNSKIPDPKIETILNESAEDVEKNQFLMSIQLTAKNASPPAKNTTPPALKPIFPDFRSKVPAQKRKYVRKNEKSPILAKKIKIENKEPVKTTKLKKNSPKDNDTTIKNIKNPIVRLMVSNLNKQASNLTKIVGQTHSSNSANISEQNQNEQLQSLIDSCKLNIPSSLSITLTESPRNEDGTIVQTKPVAIKPVQNYIEILKLPDKNVTENLGKTNENSTETSNENSTGQNVTQKCNNHKHTFQTMFEETIKRDESMKAQLFQIQNQAKSLEMAKKAANSIKLNVPKTVKKQQNNALDLSTTSPKSESSSPTPNSHNTNIPIPPKVPRVHNSTSPNGSNKRNILEIAHQLSKRSRLESESQKSPNSTSNPKPKDSPSPPQQIIVNSNFSSGGSILIKRSPKKIAAPRLPVSKVPTPKLNPPNRNGGLLKFSNYTAKLATNANTTPVKSPPAKTIPQISPNSTKPDTQNNTIHRISPNSTKPDTIHGLTPNQLLEKYNITNLAQFNANLNQAQLAFQQALMVSHQLEMHRMQQQNSQKHWMTNPNILAHYENYVQSLKNQQNQMIGNSSKN